MVGEIIEWFAITFMLANGWALIHMIRVIYLTELRGITQRTLYVSEK